METARKTKVFWTDEEKRILAAEVDRLVHVTGGYTKNSALAEAQKLLAPERRRDLKYWVFVKDQLDALLLDAKQRREREDVDLLEAQGDRSAEWLGMTVELLAPVVTRLLEHPDVAARLRRILKEVDFRSSESAPEREAVEVSPRPFKLRVLVVGLLPGQQEEVKKVVSARLDLRFWHSPESREQLKKMAKACDVAVGVTDFLGHAAEASVQSNAPHYVKHSGGLTRLKDLLIGLASSRARETNSFEDRSQKSAVLQ